MLPYEAKFLPKNIRKQIDPQFRREENRKEENTRINSAVIRVLSNNLHSFKDNNEISKVIHDLNRCQYINILEREDTKERIFENIQTIAPILLELDNTKAKKIFHELYNLYRGAFPEYAQKIHRIIESGKDSE